MRRVEKLTQRGTTEHLLTQTARKLRVKFTCSLNWKNILMAKL
jgi:hypothetical protein